MSTFPIAALRGALAAALCWAALTLPATAGATVAPVGQYGDGAAGGAAGQVGGPVGVTVDGAGNVLVADAVDARIAEFTGSGDFVRAWGLDVIPGAPAEFEVCTAATTCKAGVQAVDAGALQGPGGVAVDAAGDVFVADNGNNRISQYTGSGGFVRSWGFGVATGGSALEVCTAATTCRTGIAGGGDGQLDEPQGVVLDGAGNIYVSEQGNHRLSQFTTSGSPGFVRAWGFGVDDGSAAFQVCTSGCEAGSAGGAAGQFNNPRGVALDGAGSLYVADTFNHRIDQFSIDGTPAFVRAWGFGVDTGGSAFEVCTTATACQAGLFMGGAAGQLRSPVAVALDGGEIYVAEGGNHRISRFSTAPAFVEAWGFGVDTGAAAFEVCTVATVPCSAGLAGAGTGQFNSPSGVATDCRGAVYVSEGVNHRVQRFGEPGTALPPCAPGPSPPPPDGAAPPGGPAAPDTPASLGGAAAPDTAPPDTRIGKGPKRKVRTARRKARARFRFSSSEVGSSFECGLDRRRFKPCSSPKRYRVRAGKHVFKVRATDAAGNTDATPAKRRFRVVRRRR